MTAGETHTHSEEHQHPHVGDKANYMGKEPDNANFMGKAPASDDW